MEAQGDFFFWFYLNGGPSVVHENSFTSFFILHFLHYSLFCSTLIYFVPVHHLVHYSTGQLLALFDYTSHTLTCLLNPIAMAEPIQVAGKRKRESKLEISLLTTIQPDTGHQTPDTR